MMAEQLAWKCDTHPDPIDCPDKVIYLSSRGTFGLRIHDGGSSYYFIDYCPWCGTRVSEIASSCMAHGLPNRGIDVE